MEQKRRGRPPEGATTRTRMLRARITEDGGKVFDRLRGDQTESEYLRWLIAQEARRRG